MAVIEGKLCYVATGGNTTITHGDAGDVLEFQFLGPLDVRSGRSSLHLPGNRSRALFAALLIEANNAVSIDRLIDVVWDEQPPATARQQIQNRLGTLRSFLRHGGSGQQIVRSGSNYTLEVPEERVDGLRFRRMCAEAQAAWQIQDLERAVGLLRRGLALWRGTAIQDIDSRALRANVIRWEEARLHAIENVVKIEFTRQRKAGVITELRCWVSAYPYHEGLHCRLAEALFEASRTAESLTVLHSLEKRLADELGISPGPAVLQLERQILSKNEHRTNSTRSLRLDRQTAEALQHALAETTKALRILTTAMH